MLYEYAVEPKAIGASWENFRYLIDKFGLDRGRLISRFPKAWERKVIETAQEAGMADVKFQSLVNRLQKAKREVLIRTGRDYDPSIGDWLDNAIQQHTLDPFRAIIALENRGNRNFILVNEEISEDHPLMEASSSKEFPRTGEFLAEAMSLLLKSAKKVLFVDRFFDIRKDNYKETLQELMAVIAKNNFTTCCEIHFHAHSTRPSIDYMERNAVNCLDGVIPEGMSVKIFVWQEKENGADFHARFLLTNLGGISVDAGFSAEGSHQNVLLTLLPHELCQKKLAAFSHASIDYDLIEPVLEISSDGEVRRI